MRASPHAAPRRTRAPITVALMLWAIALPRELVGSADIDELHRVVTAYYYAIGENRMDEAIRFFHQDSPQTRETRRELRLARTAYLQRTSTLDFDLVHYGSEHVVVLATHRHLRIAGIKFMEEVVHTRYVLRRQEDRWKIWKMCDAQAKC